MKTANAAVLEPVGGGCIALESVDIQASLRGLLSEVEVTQGYRNQEPVHIEAVYTFPLPLDAVLLDLTLELNGQTLRGVVQAKAEAEDRYEEAIEDGDSAILLQQLEPGLYTINVANILPGERAVVRFRYAQLHHWQGDRLRFHLPTTIAPRYGDPAAAGLAPHQVPEYALSADHGFSLAVRIHGALAHADFECPSHPVGVTTRDQVREITLSGGSALMDRDFVLVIREPADSPPEGLWALDDENYVALASFHPAIPDGLARPTRCLKIVVDCSGSMGGDSIAQAKVALHEILSLLRPGDYFNLVAFGSRHELLFPKPVVADDENIREAARHVERLDADMGGTEIGGALDAAYRCGQIEGLSTDVLLITDGQVWRHEAIVERAKASGHRIFTVGVGSAVSEAFVRQLARATGGACELVSPREDMAERIVRHFQRIHQPRALSIDVHWPAAALDQAPAAPPAVHAGDTLHVFGWFRERPTGVVRLSLALEDGRTLTQEISLPAGPDMPAGLPPVLPRMAASARLQELDAAEAAALAERYQLVTEYTSCVLVHEREGDGKSGEIPALRKVPQVLAAGWGGMGSIHGASLEADGLVACMMLEPLALPERDGVWRHRFLRRPPSGDLGQLVSALNARYPDTRATKLDITTIDELAALGLDEDLADALRDLLSSGAPEQDIVIAFLAALLETDHGRGLSRHVRRLIRAARKLCLLPPAVKSEVERLAGARDPSP